MLSRLKKVFSSAGEYALPPEKLSPDRESELIEKWAQAISRFGLEEPAILFLSGFVPVSYVASQAVLLPGALFIEFFGFKGYDYATFFENKKNVQRIIDRLDELKAVREEKEKAH